MAPYVLTGIDHNYQFIPFKTEGSTVFFNYFVLTDAEINTCLRMVLIDSEIELDLHEVEMNDNIPYGENDIRLNSMTAGDKILRVTV